MDVLANGINGLTGLLTLFLSLFDFGCDREASGGKDDVGWYPFFGTTSCTPAALAAIPLGSGYGDCGGGSGGGFLDSFFEEADPYLTTAKNFINGAYELQFGTPGRQATIKKDSSGKTTTSIKSNNSALADFKAKKEFREQNPDLTEAEIDEQVKKYKKKSLAQKMIRKTLSLIILFILETIHKKCMVMTVKLSMETIASPSMAIIV